MKKLANDIRGDTIVEVLISIIIIALVLTGGYATSTDSLINIRDAQEHGQALAVAQSQLEDLRAQATSIASYGTSSFCFSSSNSPTSGPCTSDSLYSAQITQTSYSAADTDIQTTGCMAADGSPVSECQYQIVVDWPSLKGGTDSVQLYYRVQI